MFEEATSLHGGVSVDTGAAGALGGGAQTPLHPHHLVVGADAAAQRRCGTRRGDATESVEAEAVTEIPHPNGCSRFFFSPLIKINEHKALFQHFK